jgi:hypothetical protein
MKANRRWRARLLWAGGVVALMLGFVTWYQLHYSMRPARAFEVAGAAAAPRVLIATQGSDFKDAVVAEVVRHLETRQAFVRVIDVSSLSGADINEWSALVVIHTWEMGKPPAVVREFVDRAKDQGKLIVLTTSGRGDFRIEGVDAISAASRIEDADARAAEVSTRVDAVLGMRH